MLQKHFESMLLTMLYGCSNGKEANHFCFRDANSTSSRFVACLRKRGNIQSQCFFGVSQVIPRLLPHATYVEDTKYVSWKQKNAFEIFQKHFFASSTHLCFRNNVSLFAPALTLPGPGFQKLAQTRGGGFRTTPLLTSLPCIRTKPNLV